MNLRAAMARLEAQGQLLRVEREVDPVHELAAVSKHLAGGPALLFERVRGHQMPVLVGLDGNRRHVASNLGIDPKKFVEMWKLALEHPIDPVFVDSGPVYDVVHRAPFDIGAVLPVPWRYEKDVAPFITNSVYVVKDPDTGIRNLSIHRMQLRGGNQTGIWPGLRHLFAIYSKCEQRGRPLDVAIVIGTHSALRLAAATWGAVIPAELDEYKVAGAIAKRPIEIVKCQTVDLEVPADAEVVLEGRILPNRREIEGPMADYSGGYTKPKLQPVVEIDLIAHRRDAIYQDVLPFSQEHHLMLGLPYEPVLFTVLQNVVRQVQAVHVTPHSCGKFHAVCSIRKRHDGDAKNAILAAFTALTDIRQVIVVDEDIDVFSPEQVEFAVSTRVQADRDLIMIPGTFTNQLDPICHLYGSATKVGIDATKPLEHASLFELARIPGYDRIDLDDYLPRPHHEQLPACPTALST